MVREDLVRRKLATLHGYIEELADHRDVTLQEYVTGSVRRRAVERLLQLIIEVAADINTHLVTEIEGMPPADYTDSFAAAARVGAIDVDLAARLKSSGGLRNALIHEYGDIEDPLVHRSIPLALDGFEEYLRQVTRWVSSRPSA